MRAIIGGLVAAALLAGGGIAVARTTTEVRVTPHAGGLRVDYVLPAPTERYVFEEAVADVRADTWHASSEMMLEDGVLSRKDSRPFGAFTLQITPDTASRDRRYPALTAVGEGWQVYGPYFRAKDAAPIQVTVARPKGWVVSPRASSRERETSISSDGYVYVGPAAQVRRGRASVIVAPNVEPVLAARLADAAQDASRFYARRLGMTPPATPTVIVTRLPKLPLGMHGDTTEGPVISLRLLGDMGARPEHEAELVGWVDHEIFHLWNSRFFRSRDGAGQAWLHEGMAEYAALLASREQGVRSEAQVADALSARLTGCASALGAKGMSADAPRRGLGVYDCGVLVQWIADLQIRRASNGRKDIFDPWRRMFAAAKAKAGQYDAESFLAVAGSGPADPLHLLMQPGDAGRWPALVAAMNGLGAQIAPTRSAEAEREQVLYHLLRQVCRGSYGFYGGNPTRVKLDTGDRCGVLNGDPVIDSVAGHGVIADAHAVWDAVASACAASGPVELKLDGKLVAAVPCTRPMPPRPAAWAVEVWRTP